MHQSHQKSPIENVSGITSGIPMEYQWKSAVKFGGITTGKTVDSSGNTTEFHCYISG